MNDEKKMRTRIVKAKSRDRIVRKTEQRLLRNTAASLRRAGHGTGKSCADIWNPGKQQDAYTPEDPRRGAMFCSACGEVIRHVEVEGTWYVRNEFDNLPHALSCTGC